MDELTLNPRAVARWCETHVTGFRGPVEIEKFAQGQSNPTYLLRAASGGYVLRRKPPGALLKSAHAVDREFRVQKALAGSDVPVPKVHALCEDDAVLGTAFYVMDHVEGRVFPDPRMVEITLETRAAHQAEMARVLAALHDVDPDAVGLSDYGAPGHYIARQTARWTKQYRASETGALPAMDALIAALEARMPRTEAERTLVHGDYRIDNLIFDTAEPRIRAVLDWELSTLGNPLADLAAVIMQWQLPPGRLGRGLAGVDRVAQGLMSDDDFIATYCEHRGMPPPVDFGFYLAFAFFRMGAILQGVKKRALDGNASDPEGGLALGEFVPVFAEKGLEALDG